ncbi:hypothetical protein QBC47DRAFT_390871 [Echria macrotheca]|uniref:Uncharacterized protein n=1 Tax=Echria macrotheca TaxID=438768 RepID=A0AAJ0B9A6_9PEZI|nr:hypothetical protein QBC47DRAFT_390871 [Echria macrotheca]
MMSAEAIDFSDIKEWIAEQESLPQPTLTEIQRKNILELKASIAYRIAEPEFDGQDYVSMLNVYGAAHRGRFVECHYDELASPKYQNKWHCVCYLRPPISQRGPSDMLSFPREGAGFVPVDAKGTLGMPPFSKKKEAKQYAAKCAVEWLLSKGEKVTVPKTSRNQHQQIQQSATPTPMDVGQQPATATPINVAGSLPGTTTMTPQSSTTNTPAPPHLSRLFSQSAYEDVGDGDIAKKVRELCQELGLVEPKYKLVPNADGDSFGGLLYYDAWAEFQIDAPKFETDPAARVTKVYTTRGAKEAIATKVYQLLTAMRDERERAWQAMAKNLADQEDADRKEAAQLEAERKEQEQPKAEQEQAQQEQAQQQEAERKEPAAEVNEGRRESVDSVGGEDATETIIQGIIEGIIAEVLEPLTSDGGGEEADNHSC